MLGDIALVMSFGGGFVLAVCTRHQMISSDRDNINHDSIRTELKTELNLPSVAYGIEHLLRFIIKLPFLLSQVDKKQVQGKIAEEPLNQHILASEDNSRDFANQERVVFLQKNSSIL